MKALVTSHEELRLNDPLQASVIDEEMKKKAINQVKELQEIAGIPRNVSVYATDRYYGSSEGGSFSLTSPIISIPRALLTKDTQTIFDDPDAHCARRLPLIEAPKDKAAEDSLEVYRALQSAINEAVDTIAKEDIAIAEEKRALQYPEHPINLANWKFTDDESLFFIAREIANIKSNNPLIRVISKTLFIAAMFFIFELALPTALGAALMAGAISLHLIAEKVMRSHLDVNAVELLIKYFINRDESPDRALLAGKSAIQKLIAQNTERRNGNELCRLYITPEGNNLLDLVNPSLTARFYHLNEHFSKRVETPQ